MNFLVTEKDGKHEVWLMFKRTAGRMCIGKAASQGGAETIIINFAKDVTEAAARAVSE